MIELQEATPNTRQLSFLATKRKTLATKKYIPKIEGCKSFYLCNDCSILVLSDLFDNSPFKNDFYSFYDQLNNDTDVSYYLIDPSGNETQIVNGTYGDYYPKNSLNVNTAGFVANWLSISNLKGYGKFKIKQEYTSNGSVIDSVETCFNLMPFNCKMADNTVRITSTKHGYIVGGNNYQTLPGIVWKTQIRLNGYFEVKNHTTKVDNIEFSDKSQEQIQTQIIDNYKLTLLNITNKQAIQIIKDDFLANDIIIDDYNQNNPNELLNKQVILESIDEQIKNKINGTLTYFINFTEKVQNTLKRNF